MVIQRWQSVLLLVAAVMMGLASFMTLAQVQAPDFTYNFTALGTSVAGEQTGALAPTGVAHSWILFIVTLTGALLPLIDIFLYRNLRLQMRVALVSVLFAVTVCVMVGFGVYDFADGNPVNWNQMGCAPLLALVAEVMGWQRMNADRKRLASAERFR